MNAEGKIAPPNDHFLPGDGVLHGPHVPAELSNTDQLVRKEAAGNPEVFQLLKIRESIIDDLAAKRGDPEQMQQNRARIAQEINQIKPVPRGSVRTHIDAARGGRRPTYKKPHKDR